MHLMILVNGMLILDWKVIWFCRKHNQQLWNINLTRKTLIASFFICEVSCV